MGGGRHYPPAAGLAATTNAAGNSRNSSAAHASICLSTTRNILFYEYAEDLKNEISERDRRLD